MKPQYTNLQSADAFQADVSLRARMRSRFLRKLRGSPGNPTAKVSLKQWTFRWTSQSYYFHDVKCWALVLPFY